MIIKSIKSIFWCGCADFWVHVGNLVINNDKLWVFTAKRVIVALRRAFSYAPVSEDKQNEICAKIDLLERMLSLRMEMIAK